MASRAATGRIIAILVALALSLAGAFLLWQYVSGADERALEGTVLTDVWVATAGPDIDGIPQGMTIGTALQSGLVVSEQIPAANVPPGAVSQLEELQGLVATAPILPGEILLQGRFGDPALTSADIEVPDDRVAISLQVSIPEGVAGYLTVEDRIAVIGHLRVEQLDQTILGPTPEDNLDLDVAPDQVVAEAGYVATDVEVLAVGRRVVVTDDSGNQADEVQQTEQVLVTVAVTPEDAERLTFLTIEGQTYFTLLPDGYEVPDTPGTTADSIFE